MTLEEAWKELREVANDPTSVLTEVHIVGTGNGEVEMLARTVYTLNAVNVSGIWRQTSRNLPTTPPVWTRAGGFQLAPPPEQLEDEEVPEADIQNLDQLRASANWADSGDMQVVFDGASGTIYFTGTKVTAEDTSCVCDTVALMSFGCPSARGHKCRSKT